MTVLIRQSGFAAIGECMLELNQLAAADAEGGAAQLSLGFGGDTLNTTLYLSRLDVPASYVTVLGDDARSQWMLDEWAQEGINSELVVRMPGRRPGLYWITTDDHGERSFAYWRSEAPARELFDAPERVAELTRKLSGFGMVYLTGITLSLYSPEARDRLYAMLATLREQGVVIGFDGNFRPAAWPVAAQAREAFEQTARLSHVVLPTFEDEALLFGDDAPEATITRLRNWGVAEVVVKLGGDGCLIGTGDQLHTVTTQPIASPIDTTAAGDSFSAGYLAARYRGESPTAAAELGNRLAGQVIMHRGAIIPKSAMPE